ncbi:MAG: MerR family transcriptional regulator [Planctomycetota bacterium]|nr:MerR family transcriptional regulator [Planctomycetota bacterium]
MRAGELAEKAGINFETLRFYEREGVLPEPKRQANGYRKYETRHVEVLQFVKKARDLGFSLDQIRTLIGLQVDGESDCAVVADLARAQLADLQERISSLKQIERRLKTLVKT